MTPVYGKGRLTSKLQSNISRMTHSLLVKLGPSNSDISMRNALYVLECYRLILLQRSTMFYPPSPPQWPPEHTYGPTQDCLPSLLQSITSASQSAQQITSEPASILSLCAISLLSSQLVCNSPLRIAQHVPENHVQEDSPRVAGSIWREEFFELALNKWLNVHSMPPSGDVLILFHAIHISIYASIPAMQECIQSQLTDNSDLRNRVTARAAIQKCFRREDGQAKAIWHAREILSLAQRLTSDDVSVGHQRPGNQGSGQDGGGHPKAHCGRPPHFSHCIFHAALCFWCVAHEDDSDQWAVRQFQLGHALMTGSGCRIARVFQSILERLGPTIDIVTFMQSDHDRG